jgi:hypothetical protein
MKTPDIEWHHLVPYLAGLAGSIVSLRWVPGTTMLMRLFNVGAGMLTAGICAPPLVTYFGLEPDRAMGFVAFGVGLFGMAVLTAIKEGMDAANVKDLVTRLIRRKLGGAEPPKDTSTGDRP